MDGSQEKPIDITPCSPMKEVEVEVWPNTKQWNKKIGIACRKAEQKVVQQTSDFLEKNAVNKIYEKHYFVSHLVDTSNYNHVLKKESFLPCNSSFKGNTKDIKSFEKNCKKITQLSK